MRRSLILASLLLTCAAGAHAQLYKWVGADGKVSYSDTPPPLSARQVETRPLAAAASDVGQLPYELAQAVKNSPVTLYTAASCAPCDDGRQLLSARGVPFTEKTVNTSADAARFREIAGSDGKLPLLLVGRDRQRGFETGGWNAALSAAGYPETNVLPPAWHNPPPQAAAPAPAAAAAQQHQTAGKQPVETANSGELPPAAGNAPPGFRF